MAKAAPRSLPAFAYSLLALAPLLLLPAAIFVGGRELIAAASMFTIAWGFFCSVLYWRGLDEPSREAHKVAWFWGGSVGIGVLGALMVGMTFFPSLDEPTQSLAFGFMFTVVAQAVGYIIVWLGWWARRRF
jgi:hypothetical protein